MRYMKLLSIRGTSLLLFFRLVLVNRSVLSVQMLRSTRRPGLLLSFCPGGGHGCENVLSKIVLLDKIFKELTQRLALRSQVFFAVIEGTGVLRSGTSMVVWFYFRMLYPGLSFDGFEDVMNWEFQQGDAVVHPIGSKLALLRVRE